MLNNIRISIIMVVVLILLTPAISYARIDEISQSDWAKQQRNEIEKEIPPTAEVIKAVEEVEEVEEEIEEDPDEFFCEASHINNQFFWVPVWCLARALPQLTKNEGEVFYCKLGWYGSPDEYAVVPKPPGDELIIGWDVCADLY